MINLIIIRLTYRNSAGYVYLRFESVEAAARAQQAMHKRWFARRLISAIFLVVYFYEAPSFSLNERKYKANLYMQLDSGGFDDLLN